MRWLAPLMLIACSDLGDPARATEPPAPVKPEPPREKPKPVPLQIRWVSVRDTPPCFYFSGPNGRDDKLVGTVTSDRVELGNGEITIKINGVVFKGTFRDQELAVKRTSEHTFGGPWTVSEEIRGRFDGAVMTGTYSYRECERGEPCPGHCTIDAEIRFER